MATTDHWFREAFTQHQAGRFERAEQLYRRVLRAQPRHVRALYLLGSLHAQRADYASALPWLDQALALDNTSVEAHNNRGVALKELGRLDEALEAYDRALALRPTYAEAHNNRAVALHARGRLDEAVDAFDDALTHRPDYADAHNNRGLVLKDLARFDDALASYDAALRFHPNYPQAHNNRGVVLQKLKRFGEAVESHRHALALNPQSAEARNNLGAALEELGQFEEAHACFERALALSPHYAEAHCNLGNCLQAQGRLDEAIACYDRALALPGVDPTKIRWNRALTLLLSGDFAAGFAAYECRFDSQQVEMGHYAAPRWDGSPLAGQTILVHAEQGYGDTIQFVRYLPLVQAQGAEVIFECQPGLKTLLAENLPGIDIVERPPDGPPSALPPFDVHAPLLSLPHLLGATKTLPEAPYLRVPPALAAHWRAQVEDAARAVGGTVKIGLVWAGNPSHKNDHNRSCSLADFAPLAAIPNVALFSLQRGPAAVQADSPPSGMTVVDIGAAVSDFADTAAVLQALDLIIAVDTSVVHLAGALGRPVWILLPQAPDWRWMLGRADSPWYPTMRLFRQATTGDWAGVSGDIVSALAFEKTDSREAAGLGLLADAEAAFAAGDWARAAAALEHVLTLDPDNVRAWNDVAVLAHAQGDLDAAFAALNRALALDPDNRTARENREQCAAARQQDENPLVSVIMPCYKQAHFLAEAVQSVAAQPYERWELIIIDDGSPDNTTQTAERLIARYPDKNIRLLRQENAGLSRARNAGVEQSRGTLIFPLDSDDTIHPLMLEKTVDALRRNPEAAIAYTDVQMFGMEEGVWQTGPLTLTEQSQKTMIQYGALFRRTLFEALGGYHPLEAFEDWDFWLSCGERGHHGRRIPKPLYRYRKHPQGRYLTDERKGLTHKAHLVLNHPALHSLARQRWASGVLAGEKWVSEVLTPRPPSLEGKGEQKDSGLSETLPFEGKDSREAAGLGCPLVSVLISASHSPARLAETLACLRAQTHENWEAVIVNGGDRERKDDGRVKMLAPLEDAGRGAAWNAGLDAATGKYIAFLEAGDAWQTEHLETLVGFLEANPYRAAYTNASTSETEHALGQAFDYEQILIANFVSGVSLLCERACLSITGGFDPCLPTHEDWDLWIRLSRAFDIVHLPQTTAQAARNGDDRDSARATAAIYQKHQAHAQENAAILHAQAAVLHHLGRSAPDKLAEAEARFADGDRDGARLLLRELTALEPANVRAWNDLAVIAWQNGDVQTALAAFGRALDADPDDAATLFNGADILRALGQTEEAMLLVQRAA